MADNFARECLKISVCQLCQSVGFQGIQASACETLADILEKYIEEIGFASKAVAELGGRTECNFIDSAVALEEVGVKVADLIMHQAFIYENFGDGIPFAKDLPAFPVKKEARASAWDGTEGDIEGTGSGTGGGIETAKRPWLLSRLNEPVADHIPSFLPPFPDKHTYVATPVAEAGHVDSRQMRKLRSKDQRNAELALARLTASTHALAPANYDASIHPSIIPDLSARTREGASPPGDDLMLNAVEPSSLAGLGRGSIAAKAKDRESRTASDARIGAAAPVPPLFSVRAFGDDMTCTRRTDDTGGVALDPDKEKKRAKFEKILSGQVQMEDEDEEGSTGGPAAAGRKVD